MFVSKKWVDRVTREFNSLEQRVNNHEHILAYPTIEIPVKGGKQTKCFDNYGKFIGMSSLPTKKVYMRDLLRLLAQELGIEVLPAEQLPQELVITRKKAKRG